MRQSPGIGSSTPSLPLLPGSRLSWIVRMAWRDTRASRRRLLLFSSSIMLGIAALVAIESFGQNLRTEIQAQTKSLLGADLLISSRQPFSQEAESLFAGLPGKSIRGVTFSSMLVFPQSDQTRLVQVSAIEPGFPFYGSLETEPTLDADRFHAGAGVLLEPAVLNQYQLQPGDTVKLGQWQGRVVGALTKMPGTIGGFANLAPRLYMPIALLDDTGLMQARSLILHQRYFQFPPDIEADEVVASIRRQLPSAHFDFDTVEGRKRSLGRATDNLYHFLNLSGFVALLLGAVGIASAIHVHVRQKRQSVAVLRCLGASSAQIFGIYLLQSLALGLAGTLMGTALGLLLQQVLPRLTADLLPFAIEVRLAWIAVGKAALVGLSISLLFALLPLLAVRRVAPLQAIRSAYEDRAGPRDPWVWINYGLVFVAVTAFAVAQTQSWKLGLGFVGGLAGALALLALAAWLITSLARRAVPASWPYVWRQGLANLYRPHNRTLLLMLSLGLGVFMVLSLHSAQHLLTTQLFPANHPDRPNIILFEIYPDQKDGVADTLTSMQLPVLREAPVVNMRLSHVQNIPVSELLEQEREDRRIPRWALQREYRSSYRSHLAEAETLVAGEWIGRFEGDLQDTIPISLEKDIAEDLRVGLGDTLTFDVQGLTLRTVVRSLREVDWRRIEPNFFVVFPQGVLEQAPGFYILASRVPDAEVSAELQRRVVAGFPNVSVIDLALVLNIIDDILDRASFAVRFMAWLTVATGLLVLIGAVLTGKYQRVQESVLLRTLGASRKQIQRILIAEYVFLGGLAALTGAALSIGGGWALARFMFEIGYAIAWIPLVWTVATVTALVVLIGLLANRRIATQSPWPEFLTAR